MKTIGYCRVSTLGQAVDGVSLDAQRAAIQTWSTNQGHDLVEIYTDEGLSGKNTNRPEFQRALEQVCATKGILVCYSLSRMSRSLLDMCAIAEQINKAGGGLASCTEQFDTSTANGRMIFGILGVLCQWEREMIGERTKAAMQHKKAKGEYCGGVVPYGFRVSDGVLVPDDHESSIRRRMAFLRDAGQSYRKIADELNFSCIATRTGAKWSAKVVRGIILA